MFSKTDIITFKQDGKRFILSNLTTEQIYTGMVARSDESLASLGLEFYTCKYEIMSYPTVTGMKYTPKDSDEHYYIFTGSLSPFSRPSTVAVGKAVDGLVYFIEEYTLINECELIFLIIPEDYFEKDTSTSQPNGGRKKKLPAFNTGDIYTKDIFCSPDSVGDAIVKLIDKDIECFNNAYIALKAFEKVLKY